MNEIAEVKMGSLAANQQLVMIFSATLGLKNKVEINGFREGCTRGNSCI
jgi:hypothetical protein